MRTLLTTPFAILLCAGQLLAALPDDPTLSTPITLAVKGETLADIMDEIEKQAPVSLRVSSYVAEQKATVLVDEKPLREIMDRLALLFKLRWRASESNGKRTYELYQDLKTRLEPEEQWRKAFAQAIREMDAAARKKAAVKAVDDRLRPIRDAYKALVMANAPLEPYIRAYNAIQYDEDRRVLRGEAAVARLYCLLPRDLLDSLQTGAVTICYDSQSPEPEWQLPQDITTELLGITHWDHYGWSGEPVGVNVQMYLTVGTYDLSLSARTQARFTDGALCSAYQTLFSKSTKDMIPSPTEYLPHDPDDKSLDDKVSISAKELVDEAAIPGITPSHPGLAANRSDILALLHKKLGLQIVSDYYSDWQQSEPRKDTPARHILDEFKTDRSITKGSLSTKRSEDLYPGRDCSAVWGWDGEYLYMRIADPPLADAAEITNRQIRSWRSHYADHGSFGLNELAEMAALTESQTQALYRNWGFLGFGDEDHSNLVDRRTVPALRLYGLMSSQQQSLAFSGSVGVSSFTAGQVEALRKVCESRLGLPAAALISTLPVLAADERPVVGVYSNGVRLDRQEPSDEPLPPQPISVSMRETGTEERFWYRKPMSAFGSYRSPLPPEVCTEQEALTEARKDQPGTKITDIVREQATKYTMYIAFEDGSVREIPIRISTYRPHKETDQPKAETRANESTSLGVPL